MTPLDQSLPLQSYRFLGSPEETTISKKSTNSLSPPKKTNPRPKLYRVIAQYHYYHHYYIDLFIWGLVKYFTFSTMKFLIFIL